MGGGGGGGSGDEDSVTAGLMLEMLDISLPRVVFFNGLGELTSMALSSSGSDPVAEMQVYLWFILVTECSLPSFISSLICFKRFAIDTAMLLTVQNE